MRDEGVLALSRRAILATAEACRPYGERYIDLASRKERQ
jgi:hypothetical protein